MSTLLENSAIRQGLEHLLANDPVFKTLDIKAPELDREGHPPGFAGLVRIVTGQQVSTRAAEAIWARACDPFGHPPGAGEWLRATAGKDDPKYGLSAAKIRALNAAARAVQEGSLDFDTLMAAPREDVRRAVTALPGFGEWSAEMFMLFGLRRSDIWPAADLGIRGGVQKYAALPERPGIERTRELGQACFDPHYTAAALLIWYLNHR